MKKGIYILSFLLTPFFIMAQTFEVSVSTDSVLIGNYIELKFEAQNLDGEFEAPTLDGFVIVSGPNQSSSVQVINSSTTTKRSWSFYIEPAEQGQIIIPPAYFVTEDKTYETDPKEINIYPNPEGIIVKPQSGNSFFQQFQSPMFDFESMPPRTAPKKEPTKKSNRQIKRI
ncbi:BatD family protein [Saprospiraceae bacterium]|nr:BatD family protein [Saprospiraceae bacterium]